MATVEQLTTEAQWQGVKADPGLSLVFKHSTTCPISGAAHDRFMQWADAAPEGEVRLYRVHVIEDRPLSLGIAQETGVEHQSPQALLMREGRVLWHASHWAITGQSLAGAVADPDGAGAASHSTGLMEAQAEHKAQLAAQPGR